MATLTFDAPQLFPVNGNQQSIPSVTVDHYTDWVASDYLEVYLCLHWTDAAGNAVESCTEGPFKIKDVAEDETDTVDGKDYTLKSGTHWTDLKTAGITRAGVLNALKEMIEDFAGTTS